MSVLTLLPKSWASNDFMVSNGSSAVADISASGSQGWREKGLVNGGGR